MLTNGLKFKRSYATTAPFNPVVRSSRSGGWLWVIPATTFALGCWQAYRLQWKLALIDNAQKKLANPPVQIQSDGSQIDQLDSIPEFTKVSVTGTYVHEREMHVGPRNYQSGNAETGGGLFSKANGGYIIVTPFALQGSTQKVLVNRGWVPSSLKDARKRTAAQITGIVGVEGLVRRGEVGNRFTPEPNTEKNQWYTVDAKRMSEHSDTFPIVIDLIQSSRNTQPVVPGLTPLPKEAAINMRNSHLEYMITWFGISAASAAMIALRKRGRLR
ncbi:SURF1 family-domain-containing protein [Cladochytrium replicatum]|nr:SURF1 family-domain-containing protein [Cladochytrium replicatum]